MARFKFDDWIFDNESLTLTKGDREEILEPLHARILLCLIEENGLVVTRDTLITKAWQRTYVDERTVNAAISKLRKMLDSNTSKYIETVRGVGHKFVANSKQLSDNPVFPLDKQQYGYVGLSVLILVLASFILAF